MKLFILLAAAFIATLFFTECKAQNIPNAKTVSVKIFGNCGMCEKTIEKAALQKNTAKADWDQDTKMAQLTFDSLKTNADEILKRIAAAGYDSEKYRAPDENYGNLHSCCQYERPEKPASAPAAPTGMVKKVAVAETAATPKNPLHEVYAAYFLLKDALVASDGATTSTRAKSIVEAVNRVEMGAFSPEQHKIWMKSQPKLAASAKEISATDDLEQQRKSFILLSENMFLLMKSVKPDGETYLDHCPMANDGKGADWLSQEKPIKNPYFGKAMLTCGKVKETIKN